MCGIVGSINHQNVIPTLLSSLAKIEYRGYDSAGISIVIPQGITTVKRAGKLTQLRSLLDKQPLTGNIGIGHTRWATHGEPNQCNAHPHSNDLVSVVHNGIIENHSQLRQWLQAEGFTFHSQTDTEVIPHLIAYYLAKGYSSGQSLNAALTHLEGSFALGVLFGDDQEHLYAARRGSPLVLGLGEGNASLGSDVLALPSNDERILYLEEGDQARIGLDSIKLVDKTGKKVQRKLQQNDFEQSQTSKQDHRFYMHKEIHEQPQSITNTLNHTQHQLKEIGLCFKQVSRLTIVACGTSFYAAMVAKYWFEKQASLPVDIDVASEFRYRSPLIGNNSLTIFISQSGETADTLAALHYVRETKGKTLAIVNVAASSIARDADYSIQTQAGPEIGVASTKAFTAQLTTLACISIQAAADRQSLTTDAIELLSAQLLKLPELLQPVLALEPQLKKLGQSLEHSRDAYFIGRGSSFPIAMEGALKLKEISYIHAEGFSAGELKHGPIALIEENTPVFVIAPSDPLLDKTLSNMREVAARSGRCIVLGDGKTIERLQLDQHHTQPEMVELPLSNPLTSPILYVIPLQLIAYHAALSKGSDVDQPRNLAKSVTVE
jgi:glucosamine--fructose-6-phosphate aminotransferase (isomerizing)